MLGRGLLGHRLVEVGVIGLTGRVRPLDAVALEDPNEVTLYAFEALAQLGDDIGLARAPAPAGW